MASNYWAKLWIEMLDDRKVASLPDSQYRRFIECILLAKEYNKDGLLPSLEDMAWRLRLTAETLQNDMSRLAMVGLVELVPTTDGDRWFVSKFAVRQRASTSTERSQLRRNAQDLQRYGEDDATQLQRNVAQKQKKRKKTEREGEGEGEAETYRRVTTVAQPLRHVTVNDNSNDGEAQAIAAGQRILKNWQMLTGRTAPRDNDEWARDWFAPVNQLWARLGKDEAATFEAMRVQRQEMVNSGKTPFRPSAVVPYALAALDKSEAAGPVYDKNYFAEA